MFGARVKINFWTVYEKMKLEIMIFKTENLYTQKTIKDIHAWLILDSNMLVLIYSI